MEKDNIVQAIDVGQYVIDSFYKNNRSITTLKLQKLVFYCQAWSMVWDDEPLFDEDFEAWVNGPVVVSLLHSLQGFYSCPREIEGAEVSHLTDNQKDTIDHVLKYYGDFTSSQLVELTHREAPWKNAREGLGEYTPCNRLIHKQDILDFYLTQQAE